MGSEKRNVRKRCNGPTLKCHDEKNPGSWTVCPLQLQSVKSQLTTSKTMAHSFLNVSRFFSGEQNQEERMLEGS